MTVSANHTNILVYTWPPFFRAPNTKTQGPKRAPDFSSAVRSCHMRPFTVRIGQSKNARKSQSVLLASVRVLGCYRVRVSLSVSPGSVRVSLSVV
jgi:hypothetical protein